MFSWCFFKKFIFHVNSWTCFYLKYCELSRISHEVGWKYQDVIETLEKKRKIKSKLFYNRKQRDLVSSWLLASNYFSFLNAEPCCVLLWQVDKQTET
jgi:hypothetical protein